MIAIFAHSGGGRETLAEQRRARRHELGLCGAAAPLRPFIVNCIPAAGAISSIRTAPRRLGRPWLDHVLMWTEGPAFQKFHRADVVRSDAAVQSA